MELEKKVLICINLNFESGFILRSAVSFFRGVSVRFYVIHVIDLNAAFTLMNIKNDLLETKKKNTFNTIENILKENGLYYLNYEITVLHGSPNIEIINFSRKNAVDAIAIGTHQKIGLKELISGSTSFSVAKNSICPVLLIPLKNVAKLSEKELAEERTLSLINPSQS